MAPPRPSLVLPIVLIVLVIAGAGVGTGLLYEYNHPKSGTPLPTVQIGDNITVNYIGEFGAGPQQGRVFDTSFYSVATNNVSYPKSLEFAYRGSASQYTPLAVHVGPSGSYTIGSLSFGTVVPGFWQGLLGLSVNHTTAITFPSSEGYGPVISACTVVRPLVTNLPVFLPLTLAAFQKSYPNVNATAGVVFTDPAYGWTDVVFSANATAVVVENMPPMGWHVPGVGWADVVTGVSSTSITLTNELTTSNAGLVLGHSNSTVCGSTRFIVTGVDPAAGTYTVQYDYSSSGGSVNAELQGATFTFIVTVVKIY